MSAELDICALELAWVLDQLGVSLAGLSYEQVAHRPGKAANSPFTVVHHVIGATRAQATTAESAPSPALRPMTP